MHARRLRPGLVALALAATSLLSRRALAKDADAGAPFGTLPLVDEVIAGDPADPHPFVDDPAGSSHVTTLLATVTLLLLAGEIIRPFAWVMAFGIFTGTFSSIYVAGALLLYIEYKWPRGGDKGTSRALAAERRESAGAAAGD